MGRKTTNHGQQLKVDQQWLGWVQNNKSIKCIYFPKKNYICSHKFFYHLVTVKKMVGKDISMNAALKLWQDYEGQNGSEQLSHRGQCTRDRIEAQCIRLIYKR